jgi:steroid 5-alpha reductase family enzyme
MDTTMLLNWIDPELGSVLLEMSLLSCLALIISSIGFYRVVYFISIGYAFSIVAMSIITPLWHFESITWASALQNIFLTLWGLRLGIYLVQREFRASYREELTDVHQRSSGMTWVTKTAIWVSVSILYVLMFSPSLFTLISTPVASVWMFHLVQIAGLLFMGGGLVLEAVSDKQKSDFKSRFPKQYCNVGLYRWVRCPNYFGEITFWVGNWIMGAVFYRYGVHCIDNDGIYQTVGKNARRTVREPTRVSGLHSHGAGSFSFHPCVQLKEGSRIFRVKGTASQVQHYSPMSNTDLSRSDCE